MSKEQNQDSLGEFELIKVIQDLQQELQEGPGKRDPGPSFEGGSGQGNDGKEDSAAGCIHMGIGDDTAVITPAAGKRMLLTSDLLIEGRHFLLPDYAWKELGHKALAVNLSDIAAMGGSPRYALVSLSIREGVTEAQVKELFRGFFELANAHQVHLIGGDTNKSDRVMIDVFVVGEVTPDQEVYRRGAQPGDLVLTTGPIGLAAGGLAVLMGKNLPSLSPEDKASLRKHQVTPQPQVPLGALLSREQLPTAMIDISDGLSSELYHLREESQVGFYIDRDRLPIPESVQKVAGDLGQDPLAFALGGGEDYQLLFTMEGKSFCHLKDLCLAEQLPVPQVIGSVTPYNQGIQLVRTDATGKETMEGEILKTGFTHF